MALTIPNEGSATTYSDQAEPDSVDFDILTAGFARTAVMAGCAVSQRGAGANMSVDVAAGTVLVGGQSAVVSAINKTIGAADATNPRFDLITVNSSGTVAVTAGTAAANAVFPAIPASSVVLAAVYVPANATSVVTAQIVDKRILLALPNLSVFGDGSDGDVTISTSVTLTRDMFYRNLTVTAAGTLNTSAFRVFVSGTLSLASGGVIGSAGGNGAANGSGGVGTSTSGNLGAGSGGGQNATTGAGTAGSNLTGNNYGGAGGGGAGGAGSGGAGGAAGAAAGAPTGAMSARVIPTMLSGFWVNRNQNGQYGGGVGGGGGGGDGTTKGGGGGGGGGVMVVMARVLSGAGTITVAGGNGGTPASGNTGGGGGGGGGLLIVGSTDTTGWTGTATAAGGTHGNGVGTGVNGSDGSAGTALLMSWAS